MGSQRDMDQGRSSVSSDTSVFKDGSTSSVESYLIIPDASPGDTPRSPKDSPFSDESQGQPKSILKGRTKCVEPINPKPILKPASEEFKKELTTILKSRSPSKGASLEHYAHDTDKEAKKQFETGRAEMVKHLKDKSPEQKEVERSLMKELISKSKSRSKALLEKEEKNDQTTADVVPSTETSDTREGKPDGTIAEDAGETTSSKKSSKKQRSKRRRKVRKSKTTDKAENIEVHQPLEGAKETQPSEPPSHPPKSILKKSPSRDGILSKPATSSESTNSESVQTAPAKAEPAKTEPAKTEPAKTEPAKDATDWFKADLTKFAWIGVGALGVVGLAVYLARSR